MKKLLIVLTVTLLGVGAGAAVGEHYQNYQKQKEQSARVAAQKQASEIEQVRTEAKNNAQAYQTQIDKLTAECQKGQRAYEALTTIQKTKAQQPVCTP